MTKVNAHFLRLLLFLLFPFCSFAQDKQLPAINKGVIDLRNWDFSKSTQLIIDGEWEFVPSKIVSPSAFDSGFLLKKEYKHIFEPFFNIGLLYNNYDVNKGTYRCVVLVPHSERKLALAITNVHYSATRIFLNGKSLIDFEDESKLNSPRNYLWKNQTKAIRNVDTDTLTLVVQQYYLQPGLSSCAIHIGRMTDINKVQNFETLIYIILIAGYFFLLIYHVCFYFIRADKSLIYYSILVVVLIANNFYGVLPSIGGTPEWADNLILIVIFVGFPALLGFVDTLYPNEGLKKILKAAWIVVAIQIPICIFNVFQITQIWFHLHLNFLLGPITELLAFYFIYVAARKNLPVARFYFWGAIIPAITFVFFILSVSGMLGLFFDQRTINEYSLVLYSRIVFSVTFLLFAFMQAIVIAKRFAMSFEMVENQKLDLAITNQNLDFEMAEKNKAQQELIKYQETLEDTIALRTKELASQRDVSESLLLNILPGQIAERLKAHEHPIADYFEEVSIVFIDIVHFTNWSSKVDAKILVGELNAIYTQFDNLLAKYGLEKIKTIGDCYMAAAGIPVEQKFHARDATLFALEALEKMKNHKTEDGTDIKFRIGLDCGPVIAGVIGLQKFIYDLWGDPVNTASRMESSGKAGAIHCTDKFKKVVETQIPAENVVYSYRGDVDIKGIGVMQTWIIENKGSSSHVKEIS